MDAAAFRTLVLVLPLVEEGSHMGHADFRVGAKRAKVFASLPARRAARGDKAGRDEGEGEVAMVRLTPSQQREFVAERPGVFVPAAGAWGARGYTYVVLAKAPRAVVKRALTLAWENAAPKQLVQELAGPRPRRAR